MLQRYTGERTREHFGRNGAPHTIARYGNDQSGTKTYQFNSLGFRGAEYNPNAKASIFVFGSSYAFGTGLNLEETWSYHFANRYAQKFGITAQQINLINFADGGSSNDYITRTAISQCNAVKPDLLIAEFVFKNRSEGYRDGHAFQIGPWLWNNWCRCIRAAMQAPKGLKQEILKRQIAVNHFYHYYSDDYGFLNTLKNMLLVQSFAKANHIPYLLIWSEHEQMKDEKYLENPIIAPLMAALDKRHLTDFGINDDGISVDLAADNDHPGAQTQIIYASRLFDFFEKNIASCTSQMGSLTADTVS